MDYIQRYDSPLGGILLASDGEALTGLWFDGQRYFAAGLAPAHAERSLPVLDEARRWLDLYFSGRDPGFTPPLSPRGTAFRRAVWDALRTIPYGDTRTYGALARRVGGRTGGARAVGAAVGRNPISLIVPCHRVIGADGGLTGYAGGLWRKARLLEMEAEGRGVSERRFGPPGSAT